MADRLTQLQDMVNLVSYFVKDRQKILGKKEQLKNYFFFSAPLSKLKIFAIVLAFCRCTQNHLILLNLRNLNKIS